MSFFILIADSEDEDSEMEFSEGSLSLAQMIKTTDRVHGSVLSFKHTCELLNKFYLLKLNIPYIES